MLGRIEKISDLRTVWAHEQRDFSKWLSLDENLALLSEAVGLDIQLDELESPVGAFSVDLFATELGTGRKIIVENQLEDTNHDHLGKIITYASGKNADVIVWIVKRARDEHRQAVEWLNQHTDANIGFFLIEVELWRIGDSLPAPKFNVIERPNDWAKTMKTADGLSDTRKLQLDFWQAFFDYAFDKPDFARLFTRRKAQAQNWTNLSIGSSSLYIELSVSTLKNRLCAAIYINDDKPLFEHFKQQRDAIEHEVGAALEWNEATKDCRIVAPLDGDIKLGAERWSAYFDWLCRMAIQMREIAKKYGR